MVSYLGEEPGAFSGLFGYGNILFGLAEPVDFGVVFLVFACVDYSVGPPYTSTSYAKILFEWEEPAPV